MMIIRSGTMQQVARPGGLAALMLAALVGCGESDALPREAISGTVTLDGQPLKEGIIQFMPAVSATGEGTVAGGPIREGKFEIARNEGPTPGSYSVTILSGGTGADPLPAGTAPGEGTPNKPAKERIPAKYNAQTTLTAEVKKGDPNKFEFALTTK
jgi:hypothetical protein